MAILKKKKPKLTDASSQMAKHEPKLTDASGEMTIFDAISDELINWARFPSKIAILLEASVNLGFFRAKWPFRSRRLSSLAFFVFGDRVKHRHFAGWVCQFWLISSFAIWLEASVNFGFFFLQNAIPLQASVNFNPFLIRNGHFPRSVCQCCRSRPVQIPKKWPNNLSTIPY